MAEQFVSRLHKTPDGKLIAEKVPFCTCNENERRGPLGGVCGNCGGGILETNEKGRSR